jgi:TPR repeat protein
MYEKGLGVERNIQITIEWYEKSANEYGEWNR